MLQTVTPSPPISLVHLGSVIKSYPAVSLAYLFGSAASGQMTPLSDVDIAIVTVSTLTPRERLHLELAMADTLAQHCEISNADVRVINEGPVMLRGQVVTEGHLIFARDEAARIEFEARTRSEYFDYLPVAERLREAFFAAVRQRGLYG